MIKRHRSFIRNNKYLYLLIKCLLYIKRNGIKEIVRKAVIQFHKRRRLQKQLLLPITKAYLKEIMREDHIRICVQVHLFYLDLINEIIKNLNNIPFPYHCYISTDTDEKAAIIQNEFSKRCKKADKVYVEIFQNRGRDVSPFIKQMKDNIKKYEFILHIHSKKSINCNGFRDSWRKYLYKHLLGNKKNIFCIFCEFINNNNTGIIYPETFFGVAPLKWGKDIQQGKKNVIGFLQKSGVVIDLGDNPEFPAGNMFWARTKSIEKAFVNYNQNDFPVEDGQLDMTLAHAIERSWIYIAKNEGYTYECV